MGFGLEKFINSLDDTDNDSTNPVNLLTKTVETTCQAVGHTEDAAKHARQCHFSLLDHFGLNSLFLSISPDDECSFRVRLYTKPGIEVNKRSLLHDVKPVLSLPGLSFTDENTRYIGNING